MQLQENTESIAEDLVREFLAVRGLSAVRAQFDEACPKTHARKRLELADASGIKQHYGRLRKETGDKKISLLTSLVHLQQLRIERSKKIHMEKPQKSPMAPPPDPMGTTVDSVVGRLNVTHSRPSTAGVSHTATAIPSTEDVLFSRPVPKRTSSMNAHSGPAFGTGLTDLVLEDADQLMVDVPLQPTRLGFGQGAAKAPSTAFDTVDTLALRRLIFQSPTADFPAAWRGGFPSYPAVMAAQGVKADAVYWGIYQMDGGPCAVVATIQAFLIKHMFFTNPRSFDTPAPAGAYDQALRSAVIDAVLTSAGYTLSDMTDASPIPGVLFVTAAGPGVATATPLARPSMYSLHSPNTVAELRAVVAGKSVVNMLTSTVGTGLICVVLSCILSRGVESVLADADAGSEVPLIGAHDYGTQGLVHLMLAGAAVTGVHDGEIDLGGFIAKGVTTRTSVGVLSIFEHFGHMVVGSHLKVPKHPIWVVYNESHYSVLFGTPTGRVPVMTPSYLAQPRQYTYFDPLGHEADYYQIEARDGSDEPQGFVEQLLVTLAGKRQFIWTRNERLL